MKYEKLARDIIKNVGGQENINSGVFAPTLASWALQE